MQASTTSPENHPNWTAILRERRSRGSSAPRPGGHAGLAAARAVHVGQFWTPDAAAALLWRIASEAMAGVTRPIHLIDTSVGVGRLLQFAQPGSHTVAGLDVDGELIDGLIQGAEAAGIEADFLCAGIEEVQPEGFDIALLNPPFGLTLQAPSLLPYSCTNWGPFGPNTSTRSHTYAVHQALDAAPVVVAIVPASYAAEVASEPAPEFFRRLRAIIDLPAGTFREENTEVAVSVLVFGPMDDRWAAPLRLSLTRLDDPLPALGLAGALPSAAKPRPLHKIREDAAEPVITGPATGDRMVRVVHNGRWIHLKADCALTRARVLNAVLDRPVLPIEGHRYPRGVEYAGQGKLDIEVLLLQTDPMSAFDALVNIIREAGGDPVVDPGLLNYLRKRIRLYARQSTPFGHTVRDGLADGPMTAVARRKRQLNPAQWGSPVVQQGQAVPLEREADGSYVLVLGNARARINEDALLADFEVPTSTGWHQAHPSRAEKFPELARCIRAQLDACGASGIASWDYQIEDMIELEIGRNGYAAWSPGCGKGRLAIALCHMPGKHHAILVESHLIDTLTDQLTESGVEPALWQVIRTPEQARNLRKVNILSYETVRRPVCKGAGRRTYARMLRRRFCRVVCDEAQLLRHLSTQQTRAVWMLSPKRRFAMSGTPMPGYPQDLLPALQWVYGDGTAIQPYGRHGPYLEARHFHSMSGAQRGVDAFSNHFVVTEWVTREFSEGLEEGAKRQVPRIGNLPRMRQWIAPLLKRRIDEEPAVAAHFRAVQPEVTEVQVEWDSEHLAHYLTVAEEFRSWYVDELKRAQGQARPINSVVLLARIAAVTKACNLPQYQSDSSVFSVVPKYGALTSKQRYVISRLVKWAGEGHKSICYVDSPQGAELYTRHLQQAGIDAVAFHGKMPIATRNAELRSRFINGPAQVLVASIQTIERGHNLYCASRGIFACRSWRGDTEAQGARRMCRPQQTEKVYIEKPVLAGSIDMYQSQVTGMKVDAAAAAMDFITPSISDGEFVHMDQIMARFVADLANLRGVKSHELIKELKNAA